MSSLSTSIPSFPCKAHHAEEAAARRAVDASRDEERRLREEVAAMRASESTLRGALDALQGAVAEVPP